MRFARTPVALLLWLVLALAAARADAVVTVCGKDVWPGDPRIDFGEAVLAGGHITFACSGIIELTRQHGLHIDMDVDGGGRITIDGKGRRMFGLGSSGARVSFSRIALEGGGLTGSTNPGSVFAGEGYVSLLDGTSIRKSQAPVWLLAGDLTVKDAWIAENSGPVLVVSAGKLDVSGSRFTDNTGQLLASSRLTRVAIDTSQFNRNGGSRFGGVGAGGACEVVVTRSWFVDNSAPEDGGAFSSTCRLTVEETQFERNRAGGQGGAIFLGPGVDATMRAVAFTQNQAQSGGAIAVMSSLAEPGSLRIRNGRLNANRAAPGAGGAIIAGEAARIEVGTSTLLDNVAATAGGAIYARQSPLFVGGSLLRRNRADSGAAIQTLCAPTALGQIANSIVADNVATTLGGAFLGSNMRFLNTTVVDNGDMPVRHSDMFCGATAVIEFANTIVQGGLGGACAGAAPNRIFVDRGHNLQFPKSTCGATIVSAPPLLFLFYAPLRPFSPAGSGGDNALCAAAPVNGRDIYGAHRPQGDACSVGAVEGDLTQLARRVIRRRRGDLED